MNTLVHYRRSISQLLFLAAAAVGICTAMPYVSSARAADSSGAAVSNKSKGKATATTDTDKNKANSDDTTAGVPNDGEDFTRPVRRFDIRQAYMNGADIVKPDKVYEPEIFTTTLRVDAPIALPALGDGWAVNSRIDLPFIVNDDYSTLDNPRGATRVDMGDVLVQGILVYDTKERFGFGAGAQLIMPTGTADSFSTSRWELRPTAGVRMMLPEISKGSYFLLGGRYQFDFAGDDGRTDLSVLQFSPTLNLQLPYDCYFSLFPSTEIRYNLNTNKLFLPANFSFGKMLNRTTLASVEISIPIIKEYRLYDFKVEGRLGFFF